MYGSMFRTINNGMLDPQHLLQQLLAFASPLFIDHGQRTVTASSE